MQQTCPRAEWSTPQDLFDQLDAEFGFTLDVAATAENAKCSTFFSWAEDGLAQPWTGVCWMNPPYGRVKSACGSPRPSPPQMGEQLLSRLSPLEAVHPATVRGVCYQLFTQGVIDSMSTKNVKNVSRLLVVARENGTIPWSHIVDETRQEERVSAWSGLGDFGDTVTGAYRKDFWSHQKATIGGVIRPVLNEFAVSFQVMHGYGSATVQHPRNHRYR